MWCIPDIDECGSGQCFNAGWCIDHVNGFSCTCVDGYTGVNPEICIFKLLFYAESVLHKIYYIYWRAVIYFIFWLNSLRVCYLRYLKLVIGCDYAWPVAYLYLFVTYLKSNRVIILHKCLLPYWVINMITGKSHAKNIVLL